MVRAVKLVTLNFTSEDCDVKVFMVGRISLEDLPYAIFVNMFVGSESMHKFIQ